MSNFLELGRIEKYAAAFDLYPSGMVPEDMNILTDAEKVTTGLYIKKGYLANGTFATHIKTCISVSTFNYTGLQKTMLDCC